MLATGTKIDHYEILRPIGEGAMGEVCSAKDTRLGRKVAIKILSRELAADPDRLSRFEHEAKAVGMLNHPNILEVYDTGNYQGSPYLVRKSPRRFVRTFLSKNCTFHVVGLNRTVAKCYP